MRLTENERIELQRQARARNGRADQARRARLILLLDEGRTWAEIRAKLDCNDSYIDRWSKRFASERVAGLFPRYAMRERERTTDPLAARVLAWTTEHRPDDGSRHWSSRKLAAALGDISHTTVARIWARHGVKPHHIEGQASYDPDFEHRPAAMIGLYINPPQHAAAFRVGDRRAMPLPDREGSPLRLMAGRARSSRDDLHDETLSLYAAINAKVHEAAGRSVPGHTAAAFEAFLAGMVANQAKGCEIHVLANSPSTQMTTRLGDFLAEHRNVRIHFTSNGTWLNQVELWLARIEHSLAAALHRSPASESEQRARARHTALQRPPQSSEVDLLRSIVTNYSRILRYTSQTAPSSTRFLDTDKGRRYVEPERAIGSGDSGRFEWITGSIDRRKNLVATATKRKIAVESAEAVFGLHWFVAKGDGLFDEEGLDVEIVRPKPPAKFGPNDPRRYDHRLVNSGNYQNLFEERKCDGYRSCEWGQIRRTYDVKREGPIAWKRAPVICQAIYVRPDSPVNAPSQLANKTVGVQFHQGSHYVTIAMLEGFVHPDKMKLVHAGTSHERYEPLEKGEVDAATLVEPWITLAEKNGFKKICETHYLGLENFASDLEPEVLQALMRALRKAVKHLNSDTRRYVHYLIDEMPEKYRKQITPSDFYLPRLRHMDLSPYSREEFEFASEWMKKWDLLPKDATYERLVANVA
jgi:ABC-type nitrate/sulfonate/bicarbonate transport system substrate-binding protein/transposase